MFTYLCSLLSCPVQITWFPHIICLTYLINLIQAIKLETVQFYKFTGFNLIHMLLFCEIFYNSFFS